ncbi:hypothetical protein Nepgr_018226 [Nepenthes gracilis]|uniref:Uncharacterized protein n=1 Tax=Nepenthes gracilis TaxID=150966 RepID=A0AAD3SQX2_NEPGR|nr:hypothetical protein Nepgr_018226 [Nepenthes gracilis]
MSFNCSKITEELSCQREKLMMASILSSSSGNDGFYLSAMVFTHNIATEEMEGDEEAASAQLTTAINSGDDEEQRRRFSSGDGDGD